MTFLYNIKNHILTRNLGMFLVFFFLTVPTAQGENSPNPAPPTEYQHSDFLEVFTVKEPIHLVLIEKKSQRLLVLKHDGRLKKVAEYTCATGENAGQKEKSGDARTPEGVYFITKIFQDSKITVFGKRAFHLDYPNIFDKNANRNGDGIYIHGTNKNLTSNSTNGCVTLKNRDLDDLVQYLDMTVTPVIIVEDLNILEQQQPKPAINQLTLKKTLIPDETALQNTIFDYLYLINYGTQFVAVGEYNQSPDESSRVSGYSRSYLELNEDRTWVVRERISKDFPVLISPRYPLKIASNNLPPDMAKIVTVIPHLNQGEKQTLSSPNEPTRLARLEPEPTAENTLKPQTTEPEMAEKTKQPQSPASVKTEARPRRFTIKKPQQDNSNPEPIVVATTTKQQEPVRIGIKTDANPTGIIQHPETPPIKTAPVVTTTTEQQEPVRIGVKTDANPTGIIQHPETPPIKTAPVVATTTEQQEPVRIGVKTDANPTGIIRSSKTPPIKTDSQPVNVQKEDNRHAVIDFIEKWRRAWESKQIEPYIAFYDKTFRQKKMNLAAWRQYKETLNKQYEYIKITISDIMINWTDSGATVSFQQKYESDKFKAHGHKTLYLKYEDQRWTIVRELWSKDR